MSTRASYRFRETYKSGLRDKITTKNICLVYKQSDGYPNGFPLILAKWLSTAVKSLSYNPPKGALEFNTTGCLVAQMIAKFKKGPMEIYVEPVTSRGNCDEAYLYDIIVDRDTKEIKFIGYENDYPRIKRIFKGSPAGYATKYFKNTK